MPVWTSGEGKFIEAFPEALKLEGECKISGFGKGRESARVYVIPLFSIEDGNGRFEIERLVIALLQKPYIGCDFLISETMFSKIDSLSFRREKRELHLICENRKYQCTARKNGNEILDISVWVQE